MNLCQGIWEQNGHKLYCLNQKIINQCTSPMSAKLTAKASAAGAGTKRKRRGCSRLVEQIGACAKW